MAPGDVASEAAGGKPPERVFGNFPTSPPGGSSPPPLTVAELPGKPFGCSTVQNPGPLVVTTIQ